MEVTELLGGSQIKAVLFDFDGIIMDSEWPIYESWRRVFEGEGQVLDVETYVQCIGSDFDTWSPEKYLEELTGKEFDWPTINAKRQVELEADLVGVVPLPGVRELFEKLSSGEWSDVRLAVVSSSSHRWVDMWLEKLDLIRYVEEVVCRGDAPRIKPAPDLYLEAVKRFSLKAEECLVIEDSLNGVKAGNAAGCVTVAVPSRLTGCLDFSEADGVVESLLDLL
ncbi:MAG: HAD family hydrolase [Akkermansiaceae bacterium]